MTADEWGASTNPEDMLVALDHFLFSTARIPVVLGAFADRGHLVNLLSPDLRQPFVAYARWAFGLSPRQLPIELPVFDPLAERLLNVWDAEDNVRDAMAGTRVGTTWSNLLVVALAEAFGTRHIGHFPPPKNPAFSHWQRRQADALRDALGNPFAPVTWEPHWRTETVVALATGIHFDNAFDRLPILADALEEAGCDHAEVLNHCRGPVPHARGCWVVDAARGK